jgi:hypothetical protein
VIDAFRAKGLTVLAPTQLSELKEWDTLKDYAESGMWFANGTPGGWVYVFCVRDDKDKGRLFELFKATASRLGEPTPYACGPYNTYLVMSGVTPFEKWLEYCLVQEAMRSTVQTIGTLYVSAGGEGVYIRSQPDREARVKVWPDGTAMGLIEKAPSGWAKVQAPDGYVGYIPLEYLADKIPPTRTPAPTQPPAPPPSASTVGGPPVTVNGWTWSVYEVKKEKAVYFYQDSAVAEGTFYILFLRITNGRSGTSYPEKDLDFYLIDASGKRYTTSRFEYYAQWQYGGKGDSFDEFQPGQTSEIILLYDVPSGATGLRLVGTRDGQGAISIP